jgi:large subunit ribosomal protein L19e
MVVNLKKKRELVARMLNVGANRIRFEPDKLDDIADSITRDDIRSLIKNRVIWTAKTRGTSRARAKIKLQTKKKHGTGPGSKQGKKTARVGKKQNYVKKIRAMRYHLKVLKDRNDINRQIFWLLYKKVNGGQIRSLSHLRENVRNIKSQQ